ncbi:MAG: GNAT family N-acetyltransferase [Saprospiraceae bacterium]|nr:GNAT family N-acetyltransferase [Saprospiraceae bacterium]
MHHPHLRPATLDDLESLQQIGRTTFFETFSAGNTEEDMRKYLEEGFSQEKLSRELADPNSEFHFAMLDSRVVGYLKINFGASQTELQDEKSVEIERIYVLKAFHCAKVGQALFEKAMQIAKRVHADYVWLGVWEENPRAIAFYEKNGFVAFDKHVFTLGSSEQTDIMMKLQLS